MTWDSSTSQLFPLDGSNWILSLGSFWTGIKEMSLSSSTGKLSSTAVTSLAQRTADSGAIEASVIFKNGSFYYLFTSWDLCCKGVDSTYNIRVGRSTSCVWIRKLQLQLSFLLTGIYFWGLRPTGGFVDQSGVALTSGGGTLVLGTHDNVRTVSTQLLRLLLNVWLLQDNRPRRPGPLPRQRRRYHGVS